jgi:tetratricopeptide (TPR) repeat protein
MRRGASQLDPAFLAPRVALVRHFALSDPSQALIELARIVELVRTHFPLQHHFATLGIFFGALAILSATSIVGLFICWRRREGLRHSYEEFLRRRVPSHAARVGSWVLLVLPFLSGLGVAIPTLFNLGAMWQQLRRSERAVFVLLLLLVTMLPVGAALYAAFSLPDHPEDPPFFGTVGMAHSPFSEVRLAELEQLTEEYPRNPILRFSTAWMAQRGRKFDLARAEFEETAQLWPEEARVPNNLGNLAVLEGDYDRAEEFYSQASELDPRWAMPHYNLGQLYTRQFRYAEASEELARATSFDFELVRSMQAAAQTNANNPVPLAWGWLAPQTFWDALSRQPRMNSGVEPPSAWNRWFELRGVKSSILGLIAVALGLFLGLFFRKRLPVRTCSNCFVAVCRRCAVPMREMVYCKDCSAVQNEATAPEFSKLLLLRRRRNLEKRRLNIQMLLAMIFPGYGAVAMNHVWLGWILMAFSGPALAVFMGAQPPFWYDARIGPQAPTVFATDAFIMMIVVYALSIASYFVLRASSATSTAEPQMAKKTFNRLPRAA